MRRVDPVLARLKGYLFLSTTRQLQKFSTYKQIAII